MRISLTIIAMGLGVLSVTASAELEVIYDNGLAKPIAPYLDIFGDPPAPQSVSAASNSLGAADVSRLLPIRTPELLPGTVKPRALKPGLAQVLQRPLFLIGADPQSKHWLATHRDRLKAIGAVGMLVQAESAEDMTAIAQLADGLPILPAVASGIAASLGLSHIPVLISNRGIEQ